MKRSRISREIQWLLEEKHKGRLTVAAKRDIALLKKGEHVDYVIGFVDFLGCKIDLSFKPFIPRPETEYWVEKAIQDIRTASFLGALPHISPAGSTWAPTRLQKIRSAHIKCLDLFAGSGCIGVAVLKDIPQAVVDFGEKDKRLLSQIRLNIKKNGIGKNRYRVLQSDMFYNIKGRYDYIFANPPYIPEKRKARVQESVLKQEPHAALFGGQDGLRYIRKFLRRAMGHLHHGGKVYLEFDSSQKPSITKIVRSFSFRNVEFFKDQYKKWRFAIIQ